MLAERQKLFATLTSKKQFGERLSGQVFGRSVWLIVAVALIVSAAVGPAAAEEKIVFTSKQKAFVNGYAAYKARQYEIAVPALKFAANHGVVGGSYFLAKVFADNAGGYTDHARAYTLYRRIISRNQRVDPKDYRVARYVAKSLTAIARYHREGVPSLRIEADTRKALEFFRHAATFFNDEDAQFEIAKHYLSGDGVQARVKFALNWLAKLSKRGYAGAQAFLAGLYWDGRYVDKDPIRALALVTVAVENAPEEDRFWIEDVHHNIFCEAKMVTRERVRSVVAGWRQKYAREAVQARDVRGLPGLESLTKRTCANGEIVPDRPSMRGSLNVARTVVQGRAGGNSVALSQRSVGVGAGNSGAVQNGSSVMKSGANGW